MYIYILALLIGIVAGLRSMTAPAMTSWAANLGWLNLQGTWLAFLGFAYTPYILSVLALGELITDKLPSTPSRKVPIQFGARILIGALCGAAFGLAGRSLIGGLVAGAFEQLEHEEPGTLSAGRVDGLESMSRATRQLR